MDKLRIAVVGYGNIGKYTVQALQAAPDMEIVGIVRRNGAADKPAELAEYKVVKDITELGKVDVAILATPTRSVEEHALKCLALGINTVDSFDIHTSILDWEIGFLQVRHALVEDFWHVSATKLSIKTSLISKIILHISFNFYFLIKKKTHRCRDEPFCIFLRMYTRL